MIPVYLCQTVFSKCNITSDILGYKEAQCKHQRLTSVPINLPPDIKKLDLSFNNLTKLDANIFLRYTYLEKLLLNNNIIRQLNEKAFNGLSSLKYLSMSKNYLNITETYPSEVFESLKNLLVLDISRNMQTSEFYPYTIPVDELSNLRELSIDLLFNATVGQQFRKLYNLKKLTFDYYHVNFLYNGTFSEMPVQIQEFHMTSCKEFVVVEVGVLFPFPHLKVLNLTNSNINLTQALQLLRPFQNKSMDAILFRGITHADFKHGLDSVILTPEMMRFKNPILLDVITINNQTRVEQVQRKHTNKILPITVTLPNDKIQFVRITHLMATMYFKEIRVINSSLRHLELSYFESDVFPILTFEGYNNYCVCFVKELQGKIENVWGFKICIEDRDFIIGESIATERATSINKCRHIIFIVSPSTVENEWSRFEIERAKYEKFSKNLQTIVVITKGIALDNIPVSFSIIWKDVLLIQWPVEKDEVQMAWKKTSTLEVVLRYQCQPFKYKHMCIKGTLIDMIEGKRLRNHQIRLYILFQCAFI
ncbi:LRRC4 [Mytilus edulis]|uniref:LRRC4 n=1 Tax=Mytilus edulis TaxID=6550 RepID=A0A8S3UHG6_MYTED|nr:LRRC4 [Mytilus edulis]